MTKGEALRLRPENPTELAWLELNGWEFEEYAAGKWLFRKYKTNGKLFAEEGGVTWLTDVSDMKQTLSGK